MPVVKLSKNGSNLINGSATLSRTPILMIATHTMT